jgi:hypothetical protein
MKQCGGEITEAAKTNARAKYFTFIGPIETDSIKIYCDYYKQNSNIQTDL